MHQRQVVPSYLAYRRNQVVSRQLEARLDGYKSESQLRRAQINDEMRDARRWIKSVSVHSGYAFSKDQEGNSTAATRVDRKGSKRLAWSTEDSPGDTSGGRGVVTSRADTQTLSETQTTGVSPNYIGRLRLRRSKSDVGVYPVMVPVYVVQQNRERAKASGGGGGGGAMVRAKTDSSIRLPAKASQGSRRMILPARKGDEVDGGQKGGVINRPENNGPPRKIKLKIKAKLPECKMSNSLPSDTVRDAGVDRKDTKGRGSAPVVRDLKSATGNNQRRSLALTDSNIADVRRSDTNQTAQSSKDLQKRETNNKHFTLRSDGKRELPVSNVSKSNEIKERNDLKTIVRTSSIIKDTGLNLPKVEEEDSRPDSKIRVFEWDQDKKVAGVVQVPLRDDNQHRYAKKEKMNRTKPINSSKAGRKKAGETGEMENPESLQVQGEMIKLEETNSQNALGTEEQNEWNVATKSQEEDTNESLTNVPAGEESKRLFGLNKRYSIFLNAWHNLTSSQDGNNRIIGRPVTRPKFMLQNKFKRAVNLSIVSQRFRNVTPKDKTPEEEEAEKLEEFRKSIQVVKYIRAVSAGKNTQYGEDEDMRMSASRRRRERKSLTEDKSITEDKTLPAQTTQDKELETKIKQFLTRP